MCSDVMPSISANLEGACYGNGASMPGIRLWYASAAFDLYLYPGCPPCASERVLSVAALSCGLNYMIMYI